MSAKFNPWWEHVNDYMSLTEIDEFQKGVSGYRPNRQQELMFGLLRAGYVRKQTIEPPKPYTGEKK